MALSLENSASVPSASLIASMRPNDHSAYLHVPMQLQQYSLRPYKLRFIPTPETISLDNNGEEHASIPTCGWASV